MSRKFIGALLALIIGVGAVFAEEIRATFVKYADGKVTVKVDNKEKEYSVDEKATMKVGAKEFPLRTWFEQTKSLKSGSSKLVLVVDNDSVTGVKPDTGKTTDKKRKPKN
jgi:hypothetical protein